MVWWIYELHVFMHFIFFRYWMHLWAIGDNLENQLSIKGSVPSCGSKTAQINEGVKTVEKRLRLYIGVATCNCRQLLRLWILRSFRFYFGLRSY